MTHFADKYIFCRTRLCLNYRKFRPLDTLKIACCIDSQSESIIKEFDRNNLPVLMQSGQEKKMVEGLI